MEKEMVEVSTEVLDILRRTKGVSGVAEEITLSYIVVVRQPEDKTNVEQIAHVLQSQAKGFVIDVGVYTEQEVKEAQDRLIEHTSKNTTFKS